MSNARSKARRSAVQALYQWQMAGENIAEIHDQFLIEREMAKVDLEYFKELLHGVAGQLEVLDQQLKPFLDRDINSVDPVERAILRMGTFELMFRPDVPYRVVINEALESAKMFGADQGHKYVNGVLDKVAQQTRQPEIKRVAK
ncbi:MAG: transcription antitermination factor NusB [Pseudomonadota bacterium]|nr:transcription antitermination factor NusB [Pseudomonadota bacterium]